MRGRARGLLIGLVLLCAGVVTWWMFQADGLSTEVVGNANIVGGIAGIAAVVVSLIALLAPTRASKFQATKDIDAAETLERLAPQTLKEWRSQAYDRRIKFPSLARVTWRWAAPDLGAAPGVVGGADLLTSGAVEQLRTELYDKTQRVVILGGPGSGKTTVMLLLLIEVLDHRQAHSHAPVPVWVTLGGWIPRSQANALQAPRARQQALGAVLQATAFLRRSARSGVHAASVVPQVGLAVRDAAGALREYGPRGGGAKYARARFDRRLQKAWRSPSDAQPDQARSLCDWAAHALARDYPDLLPTGAQGAEAAGQLIRSGRVALFLDGLDEMRPDLRARALECIDREGQTEDLQVVLTSRPQEYELAHQQGRLYNAAVIEVLPVDTKQAQEFLLDPQAGRRTAWEQVTRHLQTCPDSDLAQTLTTPLALSLARDTHRDTDPTELLNRDAFPDPRSLMQHLLGRSLTLAYPDEREHLHTVHWLRWIARHLGDRRDLTHRDLVEWNAHLPVRAAVGLIGALVGALSFAVAGHLDGGVVGALFGGAAAALAVWFVFQVLVPLVSHRASGLVLGLIGGVSGGLMAWVMAGPGHGVRAGLVAGSALTLIAVILARRKGDRLGRSLRVLIGVGPTLGLLVGVVVAWGLRFVISAVLAGVLAYLVRVLLRLPGAPLVLGVAAIGVLAWVALAHGLERLIGPSIAVGGSIGLIVGAVAIIGEIREFGRRGAAAVGFLAAVVVGAVAATVVLALVLLVSGVVVSIAWSAEFVGGQWAGRLGEEFADYWGPVLFAVVIGLLSRGLFWPRTGLGERMARGTLPVIHLTLRLRGHKVHFPRLLEIALKRQVLRQAGAVLQFRHAALQDYLRSPTDTDEAGEAERAKGVLQHGS